MAAAAQRDQEKRIVQVNRVQLIETLEKNLKNHIKDYEEAQKIEFKKLSDKSSYMNLWEEGLKKTTRFENQKIYGQDNKFLYHIYRLADQAEYILTHHNLDLQERGRIEKMKAIRKGEVPFNEIVKQFGESESRIAALYESSTLRSHPDVRKIRALLVNCLEHHYGSLEKYLKTADAAVIAVNEIKEVLRKYGQ